MSPNNRVPFHLYSHQRDSTVSSSYINYWSTGAYLSHWSTGAYPRSWRQREWLYM
ncbi:hypothetical protein GBAR_LOCUS12555 [Geodia barretti]|uniref:Uncharacterized protein n=1 Tax=Geodia barretti TaxID=519541 RepID=A0AA35S2W9_GEOBA|nr:hypothetical protein GBAR_LOCUS12555 [Geodia barretti]